MKSFCAFLSRSAFRAWLAFAAWMFLGWCFGILMDGDNPLRSDDPYCIGSAFGVVAASMAGAYCLLELFRISRQKTGLFYFLIIGSWCVFLFVMSQVAEKGEGAGELLLDFTAASAIIGVSVWPLCIKKLPRFCVGGISTVGVALLALYGFVMMRLF